ncbi:polysaccharide lyase family 1 protein, partial [Desulfuromonas sp. TF]|uniref:pectate lyase family protein n=1 Tax=Desulfuromonas sp. TF TaxID=1232410 RepID=UPI000688FC3C
MGKQIYNSITKGKNLILQSVCMLLVCFGLVAGAAQDAHAAAPAPVMEAVQVSGTDFILKWSQPSSTLGSPDGGYDIFIDGVDTNKKYRTSGLNATISGLAEGEHTFMVEARFTETREFPRSNVLSAVLNATAPTTPAEPALSQTTTVPVMKSVQVVGTDFVLSWSQPDSVYGAPDGGYDIFIDGVDTNNKNRTSGLSKTISGLAEGEHTFMVEARYTETREFHRSNVLSAVLDTTPAPAPEEPAPTPEEPAPAPEEPASSNTTTVPVLESVKISGNDFVLAWSQPETVYGAPDGGYDVFIDGVDQNNHLTGLTTTVKGLAPGEHTFQVEARFTETGEFHRSNMLNAVLVDNTPTAPEEPASSNATTVPVLESAKVSGSDVVLTWSQPACSYGAPDGGYDVFIDGVDQNNHLNGTTTTIKGLAGGTHTFQVEARYTETGEFQRSNVLSAVLEGSAGTDPAPQDPVSNPDPAPAPDPSLGYLPVFPGAQGFGTETKAGRSGKVLKVTNLNDSGSGSLRAAIEASGPRIIVFEVSGTIKLASDLKVKDPYVTIAGQTAPSPGVTLRGAALAVHTHDVLAQHLRIRVGDDSSGPSPGSRDGIRITGSLGDVYRVVFDHLSVSWAVDETGSSPYEPHEITISNSILGEALNNSIHPQGNHSKGFLVREGTQNISMVGNLIAHNHDRNPRVTGDTKMVALNNVFYNGGKPYWFDVELGRASGPHLLSVVGNAFIEGPDTPHYAWPILVDGNCKSGTKVYQSDNVAGGGILKSQTSFDPKASSPPVWHKSLAPRAGSTVENWVLANAGARPADRDSVDKRLANEVKSRSGAIIDSTSEVGG